MKKVRIVFMGTPTFSVPILEELIQSLDIVLVVCQPDKEKDRKGKLLFPPCKKVALEHNIEVFQPVKIKDNYQKILDKDPELIITAAYGQIIPEQILTFPKYGCINVHGSLLPRWRGGAPIHHAIMNGDSKTGITIMYMDKKMDSGDIISQREIEIDEKMNLDELYDKMSLLGRDLLMETIPSIIAQTNKRIKQDESKVTFGLNITKEEEKINFNDLAINIYNRIRGLSSVPGAFAMINGKRMKIYRSELTNIPSLKAYGVIESIDDRGFLVNTRDYLIKITEIKLEGKKRCQVMDFINGIKISEYLGARFE